ncbi:MAG: hypothetical protein ABIH34_06770, partial [Nanoarchaeota archaeon]
NNYTILLDLSYDEAKQWLGQLGMYTFESEGEYQGESTTIYNYDPGTVIVQVRDKPALTAPTTDEDGWQNNVFESGLIFNLSQGTEYFPGKRMEGIDGCRPLARALLPILNSIKDDSIKVYLQYAPYSEPAIERGTGLFFNP